MLQGLKIVEFATYVAAPSATTVLSDWGAQVIKIESSAGDPTRHLFDEQPELTGNPVFEFENRGKRSAVIDISKPQGRVALIKILASADIFITNLRPGSLKRAQIDYDSIKELLPTLVYCSVSGYGLNGPAADLPAFDIAALWSRSGMAATLTPEGVEPFPCRPGMGDSICALASISAMLAAVINRGRTGKGQLVETSLLRTGIYAMGWDMSIQLKFGQLNTARQRKHAINPVSNYFKTADERWFCAQMRLLRDWPAIATAADCARLIEDPQFATPEARTANAEALVTALDAGFGALKFADVAARLTQSDVIWAPLQTLADVMQDQYAHDAGCFVETTDANGEQFLSPASPARFPGATLAPPRPAPRLGQHTQEILTENGYSSGEIAELIAAGIVHSP